VLQNRMHPSQQKLFDLLGTHCPPPSPVFPLFIRPSLEHQLWYGRSFLRSYNVYHAFHSSRFGAPAVVWEEFPPIIILS
jgi:hypothetical protein